MRNTNIENIRGIRNNNPLNIRHSASRWQGMRMEQQDKEFVQFENMAMGYRAAWRVLETYWCHFEKENKPYTVKNIIHRWAPPVENDSEAYVRTLCRLSGLGANEAMPRPSTSQMLRKHEMRYMGDRRKLVLLIKAMACVECGLRPEDINETDITDGYAAAFE